VLEGRADADLVVVAVVVLISPPMLVTESSVVNAPNGVILFPGLMVRDGDGRNDVAIVLPWENKGRGIPRIWSLVRNICEPLNVTTEGGYDGDCDCDCEDAIGELL
jgi:hypothetical protein